MPRRADPLPADRFWEMVTWARHRWPAGPCGLVQTVSPHHGPQIVTNMIFDEAEDGTLHFRPDNLCEPALIVRLCKDKPIRDTVIRIAEKSLIEQDPRILGQPGSALGKLLARALARKLPKVKTGNFTQHERLALLQIVHQIAVEFEIARGRSQHTKAPSCACDVAAAAWPDQIAGGYAASNAVKKARKELWYNFTAIKVTDTHLATTLSFPMFGALPLPVFSAEITFECAKDAVDYSAPLWFVPPGAEKKAAEHTAWVLQALKTSPPGSDRALPPFPLPQQAS